MPSLHDMYPSKYLSAHDIPEEGVVVTIDDVIMEKMQDGVLKPLISFKEHTIEKGMICNKTNATTIAKLYGDDTDEWIGARITLYPTETPMNGEMKACIRVRSKKPGAPAAKNGKGNPKLPPVQQVAQQLDEGDENAPF